MDHMRPLLLRFRTFVVTGNQCSTDNSEKKDSGRKSKRFKQTSQDLDSDSPLDIQSERKWSLYAIFGLLSIVFILCLSVRGAIQTDVSYNHASIYQLPSFKLIYSMEDWNKIRQLLTNEMQQLAVSFRNHTFNDSLRLSLNHDDSTHRQVTLQRQVHVRLSHSLLDQLESLELTDIAINTHTNLVSVLLTFERLLLTGQYNYKVLNNIKSNNSSISTISSNFSHLIDSQDQEASGTFRLQANFWKIAWFAEMHQFDVLNQKLQLKNIELRSFYDSKRLHLQLRPEINVLNRMDIETIKTPKDAKNETLLKLSLNNTVRNHTKNVSENTSFINSKSYKENRNISSDIIESHVAQHLNNTKAVALNITENKKEENLIDSALYRVIQECATQRLRQLLETQLNQYLRNKFGCNSLYGICETFNLKPKDFRDPITKVLLDSQPLTSLPRLPNSEPSIAFHAQNIDDVLKLNPQTLSQLANKYRSSGSHDAPLLLQPSPQTSIAQQLADMEQIWSGDLIEQAIRDRLDGHLERVLNQALYEMHKERSSLLNGRWIHSSSNIHHFGSNVNPNVAQPSDLWPLNSGLSAIDLSAQWSASPPIVNTGLSSIMNPQIDDSEFSTGEGETIDSEEDADAEHKRSKRQVPCERGQELDEYVDSLFRFASRIVRAMEPFALPNATIDLPEYNMKLFLHSGGASRAYTLTRKRAAWVYCTNESVSLGLTVGFEDLRVKYKYRAIKDWSLLWDGELEAKLEHTKLQLQFTQTTPEEDSEVQVMQRVDRIRFWRLGYVRVMIKGLGNLTQGVSMLLTKMVNQNMGQLEPTLRRLEPEIIDFANNMLRNVSIPFFSII